MDHELYDLAREVGESLRQRGWTLATAESCTGGLLGHLLTEIPGSSVYYHGGAIVYANHLKQQLLGVPEPLLLAHGAVSEPVVVAMAQGACARFGAQVALAITGIAGPGGGSPEKPVGLVYICLAWPDGTRVERLILPGDRTANKLLSVRRALELLVDTL